MQPRVLITLLGMVIASLVSGCGQKSPLFLPRASANSVDTHITRSADGSKSPHAIAVTDHQLTTTHIARSGYTHIANQHQPVASNL
jgi:predicted small lipoprotein YifL